ncbi:MAG: erythromycin esterase family protein [Stackebrandtia sp.]
MSLQASVRDVGIHSGDAAQLDDAVTLLLDALGRRPALLGLGEPTHGVEVFPRLRNQMLASLAGRHGYRSVAIESDCLVAQVVDDYVTTGEGDLDEVLETGFSHGFGALPANRELVAQLRDHNAGADPSRQVRFFGFDPPLEMTHAPSPRACLATALAYLAEHLGDDRLPHDAKTLDTLLGDDAAWENPAIMTDPSQSVGDTPEANALRLAADDMIALFGAEAPGLRQASSDADFERAHMYARTAQGLLRYHAAMASPSPDRIAHMLGLRDAMMADNLLAVARTQKRRGPCLVFANNAHLQRNQSSLDWAGTRQRWWSAGAIAATVLKDDYAFVASDCGVDEPQADPHGLHTVLSQAVAERAFFPVESLAAVLERFPSLHALDNADPRYAPLRPDRLDGADAVAFVNAAVNLPPLPRSGW